MRKISDIVRQQVPLTVPPDTTVKEACRRMRDRRVGAVLVTGEDRRLVGIFTGRDAVHPRELTRPWQPGPLGPV